VNGEWGGTNAARGARSVRLRFLLTTVGSSGDINPFIAVGRALRDRGHEATLLINPFFESAARQAGLGYLPLGEELDFRVMNEVKHVAHARKGGIAVMRHMILPHIREFYEHTLHAIDAVRPDAVLAHHISVGVTWACEARGVPVATAVLAPSLWLNPNDRPVFGGLPDNLPGWLLRASVWVGKRQCRFLIDPMINKARRDLGLAPVRDSVFIDPQAEELNFGLWSPVMRPPMAGDPLNGTVCGFPWHDRFERFEGRSAEVLAYFDECERSNDPPVMFTLGTAVVHVSHGFYHAAAEACRRLGRRGVLITNRPEYAPKPHELPAGVRAFEYAPFSAVMGRAACTVHHGGIGTTGQGLRSGRPTVIIPHAYDQFDNAARARRLGVSATLHATRVSPERLVRALRKVLDDPAVAGRAREVGDEVSREDGAAVAAAALERFAIEQAAERGATRL
jgi:rhamnosyltransferase subunit B